MAKNFKDISIKNKLILIQLLTSAIVLTLCCFAFVLTDIKSYKESKIKSLASVAQVVGSSSISALEFLDNSAAQEILSDLQVEQDITNATLIDKNGKIFASYKKVDQQPFLFNATKAGKISFEIRDNHIIYYHLIVKNGETIGMVFLRATLAQMKDVIIKRVQIAILFVVIGIALAFFISKTLQNYISKPIYRLVNLMNSISSKGVYEERAKVEGKDEIGILSIVFNDMLNQIEKRDNALIENNNLLNSILQSMGDGVIVIGKEGHFISYNNAAKKLLGMSIVDISAEEWPFYFGLYQPDTKTRLQVKDLPTTQALAGQIIDNMECFIQNSKIPEGRFILCNARPMKDPQGHIQNAVIVLHDITNRKNMENQLVSTKQQLQDIMDNSTAIVYIKDLKGVYQFVNREYEKTFNTSKEDILGHNDYEIFKQENAEEFSQNDKTVVEKDKALNFEEVVPTKNGMKTYLSIKFPLKDQKGKIYALCGISTDITERKKVEEEIIQLNINLENRVQERTKEIKKLNQELEKRVDERTEELNNVNKELNDKNYQLTKINKDLDNFIYTASHDLRSPISNMEGLVNLIRKPDYYHIDDRKPLYDMMTSSVEKFKKTIKDLEEISKVQKNLVSDVDNISFAKMLTEIQESMASQIEIANATIHYDLSVESIHFSEKNLRSILYNLISNAIKFRDPGKALKIFIQTAPGAQDYVQLLVKDNGLGIPEDRKERIFSMFKRLHSHKEGAGIGLYLVKRIVENTEGSIDVESTLGKGTIFKLYLKNTN